MLEVIKLSRGGYVITSEGKPIVQVGIPPETIKDSIKIFGEAPQYYIVPKRLIDTTTFLNTAEIEFPIYFNYFIKRRKTYILCTKEQESALKILFKESLIGSSEILEEDFGEGIKCNIEGEMLFFRRKDQRNKNELFEIENSVEFIDIEKDVFIGDIKVKKFQDEIFFFRGDKQEELHLENQKLNSLPYDFNLGTKKTFERKKLENFTFPRFGFTCLGSSNGFDPEGTTSGFILWINGKGIFIDPPAGAFNELEKNNIPISSIVGIILTHCHADHDAGTLQSMLRGNKVRIYTTKTIWESFKTKYKELLNVDDNFFESLCDTFFIKVGRTINIENANFRFHYALHSIPTIGFTVEFEDKTLFYSSDTFVSDRTKLLLDEGIISPERYDFVMNYFKKFDYILHEAGGGLIHADISYLDFETRENQYVYAFHCPEKDYINYINTNKPKGNLLYPKQGVENTVSIISQKRLSKFDAITSVKLFLDLPLRNIKNLELNSEFEEYGPNEVIIREGETENKDFYIITEGYVKLFVGDKLYKEYLVFDFFGESAILTNKGRSATIVAGENGCKVLRINGQSFLENIKDTKLYSKLKHLAEIRSKDTWNIFLTEYFENFTPSMKLYFEMILNYEEHEKETVIWNEEKTQKGYFLIDGKVLIETGKKRIIVSSDKNKYTFLGDIRCLLLNTDNTISQIKVISEKAKLFSVNKEDLKSYFYDYPIILPRFSYYTEMLIEKNGSEK